MFRRLHDDGVPALRGPKGGRRHLALPPFAPVQREQQQWWDVRMVHAIAQFAGRGWHIPKNITGRLRYF